jgi:butyrate kinase
MGGLLRPLEGGVYRVNQRMLSDARSNLQGEHASNLGCALAYELAQTYGCDAFVVDPVSVDEFERSAYYSGHPLITRKSLSHALNIHASARWAAGQQKVPVEQSAFVIGHLGGGISIAAVRNGRIIDVNDAASDGPFSPERTGGLPLQQFIALCCSDTHSESDLRRMVMGNGGLVAYLGTNSTETVERMILDGDQKANEVYEAMAYQIAKATVLRGKLNGIVLTGGMSRSTKLMTWITERIQYIARVMIHPGDDEMKALASAVLRVFNREEQLMEY